MHTSRAKESAHCFHVMLQRSHRRYQHRLSRGRGQSRRRCGIGDRYPQKSARFFLVVKTKPAAPSRPSMADAASLVIDREVNEVSARGWAWRVEIGIHRRASNKRWWRSIRLVYCIDMQRRRLPPERPAPGETPQHLIQMACDQAMKSKFAGRSRRRLK